ncbi:MAG: hypothetical protein IK123_10645 [Lachnospiraceae bacterium]|nr:hypothetical protein [Lachnospiraceae bacterium]
METLVLILILATIALIIIVYGSIHNKRLREFEIKRIKESYGKPCNRKYDDGVFEHIQGYYRVHTPMGDADEHPTDDQVYHVDDITWNDLDMDEIYASVNYTESSAGDEYLYYLLRNPRPDVMDRERFEQLVTHYMDDPDNRLNMSVRLHDVGRTGKYSIYDYINNLDLLEDKTAMKDYILLAVYVVAILLMIFVSKGFGAGLLIIALLYGGISYFARKQEIEPYVVSFSYILRLIHGMSLIIDSGDGFIEAERESLRGSVKSMAAFNRMSGLVMNRTSGSGNPLEIVMDYIRMFTHIDIIKFFHMRDEVARHRDDIDSLLTVTGFIDVSIAVGSYRTFLGRYCKPEFTSGGLKARNIYHPLLEEPVANDVDLNRGMLLTGSNASGKSTMLRTLAIAAITAQSIGTVAAESYSAPVFRVYTSLALNDSILRGESYYMTEIRSLKRIIDAGKNKTSPILGCVDEVLRGTNTVERISASAVIMKQLSGVNGLILAATHDLELTELLKDHYDNYHFEETVQNDDISFAYKLLPGRATTRNAIRLLDIMGYDKELVAEAEKMAERYLQSGEYIL